MIMEKKLDSGYYFIRENGSDKIITAHYDGVIFNTGLNKKLQDFEVVGKVPPEVVKVANQGVKIINMTKLLNRKER